jgi:hypothetical protein
MRQFVLRLPPEGDEALLGDKSLLGAFVSFGKAMGDPSKPLLEAEEEGQVAAAGVLG